jgi:hypothetical protein
MVSLLAHRYIRSAITANLLTAFIVVFGLSLFDTIHLGYFDGWLIVAAPIAGSSALLLSILIGALADRLGFTVRRVR